MNLLEQYDNIISKGYNLKLVQTHMKLIFILNNYNIISFDNAGDMYIELNNVKYWVLFYNGPQYYNKNVCIADENDNSRSYGLNEIAKRLQLVIPNDLLERFIFELA